MNTPGELQDLVSEIARVYPDAQWEFRPLPSGVCFLWVNLHERSFVIEYSPREGAGVSENFPDTPPFVGHDLVFATLAEGVAKFREFLRSTHASTPPVPAAA